jgi:hypothetical protein
MHISTILAQHSPTRILNTDTRIFIYPYLQAYIKTIRASVLIRVGRCVVATDGDAIALVHAADTIQFDLTKIIFCNKRVKTESSTTQTTLQTSA